MYLIRARAAQYLRERGIPATTQSLADLASDGRGPRYGLLNGRAVYTAASLDEWVTIQLARPLLKRRDRRASA